MDSPLLTSNLYKSALLKPGESCDQISVLTGYASPAMLHRLLDDLDAQGRNETHVDLIVGMTGRDGIHRASHLGFLDIVSRFPQRVRVRYAQMPYSIHSKIYVWTDSGSPVTSFTGSSNFTQTGFLIGGRFDNHHEVLVRVDPGEAAREVKAMAPLAVDITDENVDALVEIHERTDYLPARRGAGWTPQTNSPSGHRSPIEAPTEQVTSLLLPLIITTGRRTGRTHDKWGLNWGQREGRNPNQAAIPYPAKAKSASNEDFFPRGVKNNRPQFTVKTDDGEILYMVVAEDGDKGLHSVPSNSTLGVYFRNRLGVPDGAAVDAQALHRFGSRFLRFTKLDQETFRMDFSHETEREGAQFYGLSALD